MISPQFAVNVMSIDQLYSGYQALPENKENRDWEIIRKVLYQETSLREKKGH